MPKSTKIKIASAASEKVQRLRTLDAQYLNLAAKVAAAAVAWRGDHPLPTHFMSSSDRNLASAVDKLAQKKRQIQAEDPKHAG